MNKDEILIKVLEMLLNKSEDTTNVKSEMIDFIGRKVIIRTYSAGVWFGTLIKKSGKEVIISEARRMWKWWSKESISLSAVANHGLNEDKSKIAEAVEHVWLEAIEIIPCTSKAILSIEYCKTAEAS